MKFKIILSVLLLIFLVGAVIAEEHDEIKVNLEDYNNYATADIQIQNIIKNTQSTESQITLLGGEVVEADFMTGGGNFKIRGYEFYAPANTRIYLEKGKNILQILIPKGGSLMSLPKKNDGAAGEIFFRSESSEIADGVFLKGTKEDPIGTLAYNGNFYIKPGKTDPNYAKIEFTKKNDDILINGVDFFNVVPQEGDKTGYFSFKDGKMFEAKFRNGKLDSSYDFGDWRVDLIPSGANVVFKDGKVSIGLPEGSKIYEPEKLNENAEPIEFDWATFEGKPILFENNEEFIGVLKYDSNGFSTKSVDARFGELDIYNLNKARIYLDFKGERKESETSYISKSDSNVFLFSPNKENAFAVDFVKTSRVVPLESNDHFALKVIDGEIALNERIGGEITETSKFSIASIKGDFVIDEDYFSYKLTNGKVTGKRGTGIREIKGDFKTSSTVALEFDFKNKEGKDLMRANRNLYFSNFREAAWGSEGIDRIILTKTYALSDVQKSIDTRLTYNYPIDPNNPGDITDIMSRFEKLTGRNLVLKDGAEEQLTNRQLKMFIDFFRNENQVPEGDLVIENAKLINKENNVYSSRAYYDPNDKSIHYPVSRLNKETGIMSSISHEYTHRWDYQFREQDKDRYVEFLEKWLEASPARAEDLLERFEKGDLTNKEAQDLGFTEAYGSRLYKINGEIPVFKHEGKEYIIPIEDYTTYMGVAMNIDKAAELAKRSPYARAKFSLLTTYGPLTRYRYEKIMTKAGYGDNPNDYI